jgi:hypothetical protein
MNHGRAGIRPGLPGGHSWREHDDKHNQETDQARQTARTKVTTICHIRRHNSIAHPC